MQGHTRPYKAKQGHTRPYRALYPYRATFKGTFFVPLHIFCSILEHFSLMFPRQEQEQQREKQQSFFWTKIGRESKKSAKFFLLKIGQNENCRN